MASTMSATLAACTGDDAPDATPSEPSTATSSAVEAPTDEWREEFSTEDLQAYDAALAAFETYEDQSLAYWEAGVASPEAEAFFSRWWFAPMLPMNLLQTYEASEVVVDGDVTVLESRAQSVGADGVDVEIVQCVDPTTRTVTQRGTPAPGAATEPLARIVSLSQDGDGNWRLTSLPTTEDPC
ncbi:hypothetical protein RDV89_17440 [Nocardioides zeae]|uniref:Secreted protein n=1 Tax=Nocardioides imazamoxiresistens TaxID=3231893 RepID=A0ABU3Q173_9ACTN|nr:hypothetical protein [Nocardioides zeae]MDT9594876.1 hypothetical protein [Nocardioides zeae]